MKTEIKLITPAIAEEMLEMNTMNRCLKPSLITEYSRQMKAGLWKEGTGEAIKIASDGTILDGQHRLVCITKCNISIECLIITGLEKDIFPVLDTGKSRSAADVFHISGVVYSSKIAAGVKRYYVLKKGRMSGTSAGKENAGISNTELLILYNKRVEFWIAVNQMAQNWYTKFQRVLTHADIFGLYSFFYDLDNIEAFTFMDSLCIGNDLNLDSPIKCLRDKLIFAKTNTKMILLPSVKLAYIYKAWNVFRSGKSMTSLRFNNELESFPVPK